MNRQEAIAELENLAWVQGGANRDKATEAISMAIKALKEPQNDWIPCNEKLPLDEDYDETFTVTIQCEHYDGWDDYVTGYADWTPHGWDIQSYYMGQIKVVAWMPLPEAWKGDENGR